jgi:hypothetical protein
VDIGRPKGRLEDGRFSSFHVGIREFVHYSQAYPTGRFFLVLALGPCSSLEEKCSDFGLSIRVITIATLDTLKYDF